jgi:glycosyltransferase involved in cell wall biosynthesis
MSAEEMEAKGVSVVVPAYNMTNFIPDALQSVLAQTYRNFEIIVVNDGCPDSERLETVLKPFASMIRYLRQENQGVGAARNTAIGMSHGAYIALLDADDIWEPQYLERQVGFLETHREFEMVYPDAILFGDSPLAGRRYMDVSPSTGDVTIESLLSGSCNVFISVLARKRALVNAGLFDPSLRAAEDFQMWLRILLSGGRIGYQREPLVRRRIHAESLSADRVVQTRRAAFALSRLLPDPRLSAQQVALVRTLMDRLLATAEIREGKRALAARRPDEARQRFASANTFVRSAKLSLLIFLLRVAPALTRRFYQLRRPA